MKKVFVDTSAWYAVARREDPHHKLMRAALDLWAGRLVTSDAVFSEAVTLARRRAGHAAAVHVGEVIRTPDVAELVGLTVEDQEDAWAWFVRHKDKAYSFTDCASFAVMRRLRIPLVITLDRHFLQAGFEVLPAAS